LVSCRVRLFFFHPHETVRLLRHGNKLAQHSLTLTHTHTTEQQSGYKLALLKAIPQHLSFSSSSSISNTSSSSITSSCAANIKLDTPSKIAVWRTQTHTRTLDRRMCAYIVSVSCHNGSRFYRSHTQAAAILAAHQDRVQKARCPLTINTNGNKHHTPCLIGVTISPLLASVRRERVCRVFL
jgi:hypothetical protein